MPSTISNAEVSDTCVRITGGGLNTIDVAESTGLALLRVVQTAGPVDCDVTFVSTETRRALYRVV